VSFFIGVELGQVSDITAIAVDEHRLHGSGPVIVDEWKGFAEDELPRLDEEVMRKAKLDLARLLEPREGLLGKRDRESAEVVLDLAELRRADDRDDVRALTLREHARVFACDTIYAGTSETPTQSTVTCLKEEDSSLGGLASRLGYQSEAAFSRAFKRFIGISPGAVRRNEAGAGNERALPRAS
jgi:AraC-like DNA-binding protein